MEGQLALAADDEGHGGAPLRTGMPGFLLVIDGKTPDGKIGPFWGRTTTHGLCSGRLSALLPEYGIMLHMLSSVHFSHL